MSQKVSAAVIAEIAVVAAIYAALTVFLAPFSYGALQVRLSEALMLLCTFRKRWCVSLTLGCMIANLFSGMAADFLFGTIATFVAAILMYNIKKPAAASVVPAIANGFLVGGELWIFADVPFLLGFLGVAVGELIAVAVVGLPILRAASRSRLLCKLIGMPYRDNAKKSDNP